MAEGTWDDIEGAGIFALGERPSAVYRRVGHIYNLSSGGYRAVVYPVLHTPGADQIEVVAANVSERAAKKAVREYWDDKNWCGKITFSPA